jgi:nicotinic acid mononucleotide adenylyltransferase
MGSMKIFCEIPFKDKTLTELDVSGKNLGTEGALVVADYLDGNKALLLLNLANNSLGELVLPKGWTKAGNGNMFPPFVFKHADGREQKESAGSKPEGVIAIASAIPDMGALLQTLNLAGNNIGGNTVREPKTHQLNYQFNLSCVAALVAPDALPCVEFLNLENNTIGAAAAAILGTALQNTQILPRLKCLSLDKNVLCLTGNMAGGYSSKSSWWSGGSTGRHHYRVVRVLDNAERSFNGLRELKRCICLRTSIDGTNGKVMSLEGLREEEVVKELKCLSPVNQEQKVGNSRGSSGGSSSDPVLEQRYDSVSAAAISWNTHIEQQHIDADAAEEILLVLPGCFNPVHDGHIGLLTFAKEALERSGSYKVAAASLVPSHDEILVAKTAQIVSAEHRVIMCNIATERLPWVIPVPKTYKSSTGRVEALRSTLGKPGLRVFVVHGMDCFDSMQAHWLLPNPRNKVLVCICNVDANGHPVDRPGNSVSPKLVELFRANTHRFHASRFLFLERQVCSFTPREAVSSTQVRRALHTCTSTSTSTSVACPGVSGALQRYIQQHNSLFAATDTKTMLLKYCMAACMELSLLVEAIHSMRGQRLYARKRDGSVFSLAEGLCYHLLKHSFLVDKFSADVVSGVDDSDLDLLHAPGLAPNSLEVDASGISLPENLHAVVESTRKKLCELAMRLHPTAYTDLVPFIDSLNASSELLAAGTWGAPTISIGFAQQGLAVAGIIYRPLTGECAAGCSLEGFAIARLRDNCNVSISDVLSGRPTDRFGSALSEHLGVGQRCAIGLGNRVLMLLQGEGRVLIQQQPPSGLWEICAADAVLQAHGGNIWQLKSVAETSNNDEECAKQRFAFHGPAACGDGLVAVQGAWAESVCTAIKEVRKAEQTAQEEVVERLLCVAARHEARLTAQMRTLSAKTGTVLAPTHVALKPRASLAAKVAMCGSVTTGRQPRMVDVLRYTVIADPHKYADAVKSWERELLLLHGSMPALLSGSGTSTRHTLEVANFWSRECEAYHGLHFRVLDMFKDEQIPKFEFEIQFHTPASYRAAQSTHARFKHAMACYQRKEHACAGAIFNEIVTLVNETIDSAVPANALLGYPGM